MTLLSRCYYGMNNLIFNKKVVVEVSILGKKKNG